MSQIHFEIDTKSMKHAHNSILVHSSAIFVKMGTILPLHNDEKSLWLKLRLANTQLFKRAVFFYIMKSLSQNVR